MRVSLLKGNRIMSMNIKGGEKVTYITIEISYFPLYCNNLALLNKKNFSPQNIT